jgi:hypothetical protein
MAYKLISFFGITLPERMVDEDVGTPSVDSALIDNIGASLDYFGVNQRYARRHTLTYKGMYVAASASALDSLINNLYAKLGTYGDLVRQRISNGDQQNKKARLLSVKHQRPIQHAGALVAEVELTFESAERAWRFPDIVTFQSNINVGSPLTFTVTPNGNFVADDPTITFIPGNGTLSSLRLVCTALGVDWTYTGAVFIGTMLAINCGIQTVRAVTSPLPPAVLVDAYANFALAGTHTARSWLPLAPGGNSITVTVTGAGGLFTLSYYHKWV